MLDFWYNVDAACWLANLVVEFVYCCCSGLCFLFLLQWGHSGRSLLVLRQHSFPPSFAVSPPLAPLPVAALAWSPNAPPKVAVDHIPIAIVGSDGLKALAVAPVLLMADGILPLSTLSL